MSFSNQTDNPIQIGIEPEARHFDLPKGSRIDIELELTTDQYDDKFEWVLTEGYLTIYECRQYVMKIFIDDQLIYQTPQGRYR